MKTVYYPFYLISTINFQVDLDPDCLMVISLILLAFPEKKSIIPFVLW